MTLLLDTNALLWSLDDSERLSQTALRALNDQNHEKFLSIASFWEITIKVSINKLVLWNPIDEFLQKIERDQLAQLLHIRAIHLRKLRALPFHHKDPFDRMIVAQALADDLTLVSSDAALDAYGIRRLW